MRDAAEAARRDAETRRLAQTEFGRPLVVEAGAGTGKTATLVARILAWCLGPGWERAAAREPQASPGRIAERVLGGVVAITFTEAAAAEMDRRVASGLACLARGERLEGFTLEAPLDRVEALRGGLDALVVQTIHATCRRLLASRPLEAGLHPFFEVDADGAARGGALREVVGARLGELYARGDVAALGLAEKGIGPREIEEALVELTGRGVSAEELTADPLGPERIAAFWTRLAEAHRVFDEAATARLAGVAQGSKARVCAGAVAEARRLLGTPPANPEALARLRERLLRAWPDAARRALVAWRRDHFSAAEAEALAERRAAAVAAAGELAALLAHLERVDVESLGWLLPLLAALCREVEEKLRARGRLGFDALLAQTQALLARPRAAERVRRGIDQLLVDEFQDTDPRQCAIVAALALEGPPDARPGLFLVGDPKQSIYGWRNADLGAYEGFVQRVLATGGALGSLCVNHRSVPAVLDEVERVVAPVMERRRGLQPAFEVLVPSPKNAGAEGFAAGRFAPVEIWVSAEADGDKLRRTRSAEAARLEARALAADVRALHDAHRVTWRDVALLFRSRGDWDVYLGALREAGVPFSVEGDRTYYRRREILDASAWLRCVLDPGDTLALVAALRCAAAGVPDAAWLPLWARGFAARVGALEAPDPGALEALRALLAEVAAEIEGCGAPGLARVRGWELAAFAALEALAALRRSFAEDPADVFVERLRAALVFEGSEAARLLGRWRAANLERFFGEVAAQLAAGAPTAQLLRRLRHAVAEEETPAEEPAGPESLDAVRVLTLHGAKGLDWRHVYLVQLHKGAGAMPLAGEVGRVEGHLELVACGVPSLAFDAVAARRDAVAEAERVRTLYVGMTRARERLVLCGLWPEFQERRGASHAELLARRQPAAPDLAELARAAAAAPHAAVDAAHARWVFPAYRRVELAAPAVERRRSLPPPDRDAAEARDAAAARAEAHMARRFGVSASELAGTLSGARGESREAEGRIPVGRRVGSALHRVLERLDLEAEPTAETARQRAALAADLARSTPPAQRDGAVREALARWDVLAAGPLLARLRALRERILARELPLLLAPRPDDPATGFVAGAIDLLYRDADGTLVVADYKTDRLAEGAEARERRAHYARQGAVYQRAVAEALGGGVPPRFELWWLAEGRVEVVAPAGVAAAPEGFPRTVGSAPSSVS